MIFLMIKVQRLFQKEVGAKRLEAGNISLKRNDDIV